MTSSKSSDPHPLLEKPEPNEYLNENSPIPHSFLTIDQLKHLRIIHFILTQKSFSKCVCHSFHNKLTINQILTTINRITLTKMPYSPLFIISHYHFSNPLSLPLYNNPDDNNLCQTRLYHLTTALHEKHFTTIGLTQTITRFTAQKANRFSINHYDHAIARSNEDFFLDDETNASP